MSSEPSSSASRAAVRRTRGKLGASWRGRARYHRCLEFILSGDGAPASVRAKLQELEASKARLEAELADLGASLPPQVAIHPNVPELYRRKFRRSPDLLTDETAAPSHGDHPILDRADRGGPAGGARSLCRDADRRVGPGARLCFGASGGRQGGQASRIGWQRYGSACTKARHHQGASRTAPFFRTAICVRLSWLRGQDTTKNVPRDS
jgi:hypothetical protein